MRDMTLLEILWTALGMTKANYIYSLPWWTDPDDRPRNYFHDNINDCGTGDYAEELATLVNLGLMRKATDPAWVADKVNVYIVTPDGIALAKSQYSRKVERELHGEAA